MDYTLGLDIGITSVGACAIDQKNARLVELSVRKFDEATEAKEARLNRSARRTLRRKKWRKEQLLNAFNDFGIISSAEIGKEKKQRDNYLSFYGKGINFDVPDVYTVYHLRKKALSEKVSKREILLCLYNILQARGHFLLDTIDFSKDGLTFDIFKERFYYFAEQYVTFTNEREEFEKSVLQKIFTDSIKLNDLKKIINDNRFTIEDNNDLLKICSIIKGGKAEIGSFYNVPEEKAVKVEDLKKSDELNEFQSNLVELYDFCRISKILKGDCQYVCDIAVNSIDDYAAKRKNGASKDEFKELASISKSKTGHIRSYKNLNNSYPNGLYVKEIKAILKNQQNYYPEITDEFIEVCSTIASARIPYYIGPLGENAKNKWAVKNGNIKYSFDYSKDNVNIIESIKNWKKNMISHCTYLPEYIALPKGSLLGEVFSIINEINNYTCIDKNGNDYYLTREDKIRIFDELFLKKDNVTFKDVEELLELQKYGSIKEKTSRFNTKISLYKQIVKICPELQLNTITDIFSRKDLISKIEDLILDINLFDDGSLKINYFKQNYSDEQASKLGKLKTNGFYSFSKEFIFETVMNQDGETMMDILFNDNDSSIRNNQQVIVSNACDKDGNKIDFLANKYEKIIKENDNKLSIDLIINNGKPVIPVSRPVIRALNETFKVYNAYLEIYGVPSRVVIETAKGKDSIKDFTEQKTFNEESGSSMKHYSQMPKLVDYLFEQIDEKDKNNAILQGKIEEWNEIEAFYNNHKQEIELYIRQDGIDLLTGKKIDLAHLEDYEIDHILPRGFGDDSQDDKMLISRIANGVKGDRLPLEFLESPEARDLTRMTVSGFEKIVNMLAEMKMISKKKQQMLLLKDQKDAEGFINQNLVDTRYIISQFASMLKAFNKANGYDTHVVCMNSAYTKLYSRELGFRKNRDLGDQHHAYDAACICIADKCLNEYFPNYDQQKSAYSKKGNYAGFGKYSEFVKELNDMHVSSTANDKLRRFVHYAFKKAYGQDVYKLGKEAPLIEEIKNTTPLLSWKVERNYKGKLFDATLYKPKREDDKSVLTILGVNNDKRSFDSVYPVAVDFYKINQKHYAVHIPYVIVDSNGQINKEKYIKLIKEHYKAPELLNDDQSDINENAFRFRAFKRDLIFDTQSNTCHLFNLGSIAIKLLEICPMNIFSYSDIYDIASSIRTQLISNFNIKTNNNPDGVEFKELDKEAITSFICDQLGMLDNPDKHKGRLLDLTKNISYLGEYCEKVAYLSFLANDVYTMPKFDGQILPSANNNVISKNKDAQYIKIKYNTLGIRVSKNEKGTLIVNGPRGYKNGGFKLIRKEEFHWTLSKY